MLLLSAQIMETSFMGIKEAYDFFSINKQTPMKNTINFQKRDIICKSI